MDKLIVAVFGVNRFNLLGWCFAFLLVIVVSSFLMVVALVPEVLPGLSPLVALLLAACFPLVGIFGVLLQIYFALFEFKLEWHATRQAAQKSQSAASNGERHE